MLTKDSGVILSASRSGETSISVVFLGRRSGKVRLMAKGVIGPRHPTRGVLEPGNEIEVLYYHREGYSTYYIKESSLIAAPGTGRESLPHMAAGLAALELLNLVCAPGASVDGEIVDTAAAFLGAPQGDDPLLMFLAFEIKLLSALGLAPDTMSCVRCGAVPDEGIYSPRDGVSVCAEHREAFPEAVTLTPDVVRAATRCAQESFDVLAGNAFPRSVRKELGRLVHWTYTYHVQGYHLPTSLNLI